MGKRNPTNASSRKRRSYSGWMCGRFTNTVGPEELTEQIGRQFGVQIRETIRTDPWDVRPTDPVPAIVVHDDDSEARMLRWALVPAAASTVKTKRPWINATVEGLRSKGSYFGVAPEAAHRALILADGFYEWPTPEDAKAKSKLKPPPMRFTVDGGRVFCFAGLWVTARHVEGGPVASCTIITCDSTANRVVAPVHNRMPVILADPDGIKAWLDPAITPAEALSLCEPLPAGRMASEIRALGAANADSAQVALPAT
jgi:putative SOS response-associated peptidase YedK